MNPEDIKKPVTLHSLAEILRKWKPAQDLQSNSSSTWRQTTYNYSSGQYEKRRLTLPDLYRRVSIMVDTKLPRRRKYSYRSPQFSDDDLELSERTSTLQRKEQFGNSRPSYVTPITDGLRKASGFWRNCANIITRKRASKLPLRQPSNNIVHRFIPQRQEIPSTSRQREFARKDSQALQEWRLRRERKARAIFGLPDPEPFWLPHMISSDEDVQLEYNSGYQLK